MFRREFLQRVAGSIAAAVGWNATREAIPAESIADLPPVNSEEFCRVFTADTDVQIEIEFESMEPGHWYIIAWPGRREMWHVSGHPIPVKHNGIDVMAFPTDQKIELP